MSVGPVKEPAAQLGSPKAGPVSGLGAMEHRNLSRGFCSEECLLECVFACAGVEIDLLMQHFYSLTHYASSTAHWAVV